MAKEVRKYINSLKNVRVNLDREKERLGLSKYEPGTEEYGRAAFRFQKNIMQPLLSRIERNPHTSPEEKLGVAAYALDWAREIGSPNVALSALKLYESVSPKSVVAHKIIKGIKDTFEKGEEFTFSPYTKGPGTQPQASVYRYTLGKVGKEILEFYKDKPVSQEDRQILSDLEQEVNSGERRGWAWKKPAKAVSIIALAGGLFFLSTNITGNVIGNQTNTNIMGAVLLVIGIVLSYFWIRNK